MAELKTRTNQPVLGEVDGGNKNNLVLPDVAPTTDVLVGVNTSNKQTSLTLGRTIKIANNKLQLRSYKDYNSESISGENFTGSKSLTLIQGPVGVSVFGNIRVSITGDVPKHTKLFTITLGKNYTDSYSGRLNLSPGLATIPLWFKFQGDDISAIIGKGYSYPKPTYSVTEYPGLIELTLLMWLGNDGKWHLDAYLENDLTYDSSLESNYYVFGCNLNYTTFMGE